MCYRAKHTSTLMTRLAEMQELLDAGQLPTLDAYGDIFHGSEYLSAVKEGKIGDDDFVLMMSLDGA